MTFLDSDEERSTSSEADAQKVAPKSLELKSKRRYETAYKRFSDWCKKKKIRLPTESDCLAFFVERGNFLKPTSLWTEFSMINALLVPQKGVDLKQFSSLTEFMKQRASGYQSKTTKVFTREQITKFLKEAPDSQYLMMKVSA